MVPLPDQEPLSQQEPPIDVAPHPFSTRYTPEVQGVASIRVGDDSIRVSAVAEDVVRVVFGRDVPEPLDLGAADVTQWCAETSVLVGVTLELAAEDEVRIRTPMLVARQGPALAVARHVTGGGSSFIVAVASTSTDLAHERTSLSIDATPGEIRLLLEALKGAAAAATSSRKAL